MHRKGISNLIAAGLLVIGILIGALGFYVATTYQSKVIYQTTTATTSLTSTATSTISLTATTIASTTTTTSHTTSTFTTSVYPVPSNISLVFSNVDGEYNFNIQSATYNNAGALAGPNTIQITGLFQGEPIAITASSYRAGVGCAVGEHFTMQLWVNGQNVAQSASACGSNAATISYTV
jgi:hypothetical protein